MSGADRFSQSPRFPPRLRRGHPQKKPPKSTHGPPFCPQPEPVRASTPREPVPRCTARVPPHHIACSTRPHHSRSTGLTIQRLRITASRQAPPYRLGPLRQLPRPAPAASDQCIHTLVATPAKPVLPAPPRLDEARPDGSRRARIAEKQSDLGALDEFRGRRLRHPGPEGHQVRSSKKAVSCAPTTNPKARPSVV